MRFILLAFATLFLAGQSQAATPVIEITQTGCQFVEAENDMDHHYKTNNAEDCNAINAKTATDRLSKAAPLELSAGKYVFRVTNKNVPYEVGFWLRDQDYNWKNPVHKLTKTSVSGGGLTTGISKDYEVELKPGTYHYSCPLNPTPNYTLIVK